MKPNRILLAFVTLLMTAASPAFAVQYLKQSTAKVVQFGPFVDKADAVTLKTGLISALDHATTGIMLSKDGAALAVRSATVTASTYDAYGNYRVTLSATDTGTLGTLRMQYTDATTCLPVWRDFVVVPANIYDSLIGGTDLFDVSVTQWNGTAVATPATAGVPDVNIKNINNISGSGITGVGVILGTAQPINFTGTSFSALVKTDVIDWSNTAVSSPTTAGIPEINVKNINNVAAATPGAAGGLFIAGTNAATTITTGLTTHLIGTVDTVTTYTGNTPQTGDSFARIGATGSGLTSLAPSATALSTVQWTNTKAGFLDAAISSVGGGGGGDPWATVLPGAYAAGTAGKIIGDLPSMDVVVSGDSLTALASAVAEAASSAASAALSDPNGEPVSTDRTFVLKRGTTGLVAEFSKAAILGSDSLYAVDFRNDMAANDWITVVSTPTLVSGTAGGVTFGTPGRAGSQAKVKIAAVTAGTYVIQFNVTYHSGNTQTGRITFKVVQ